MVIEEGKYASMWAEQLRQKRLSISLGEALPLTEEEEEEELNECDDDDTFRVEGGEQGEEAKNGEVDYEVVNGEDGGIRKRALERSLVGDQAGMRHIPKY